MTGCELASSLRASQSENLGCLARPHSVACVAANDAPLIGQRAQRAGAAQRKVAMRAQA